jgi:hypothetical protein
LCTDYPDWSIAAAGSEAGLRIGYEYARFASNMEQQQEPKAGTIHAKHAGGKFAGLEYCILGQV